jgi:hypothetical protein
LGQVPADIMTGSAEPTLRGTLVKTFHSSRRIFTVPMVLAPDAFASIPAAHPWLSRRR